MTEQQVKELMESSKNLAEWNANCKAVWEAFGGYPFFWFPLIVKSGVQKRTRESWK